VNYHRILNARTISKLRTRSTKALVFLLTNFVRRVFARDSYFWNGLLIGHIDVLVDALGVFFLGFLWKAQR
jgi:hypothetical protein